MSMRMGKMKIQGTRAMMTVQAQMARIAAWAHAEAAGGARMLLSCAGEACSTFCPSPVRSGRDSLSIALRISAKRSYECLL